MNGTTISRALDSLGLAASYLYPLIVSKLQLLPAMVLTPVGASVTGQE